MLGLDGMVLDDGVAHPRGTIVTALLVDAYGGKEIKLNDRLVALGNTNTVGSSIFRDYLVPFEVVSMLLLAALVGAVVIARRD